MRAMQSNLSSGDGAAGLLGTLTSGKHDGSIYEWPIDYYNNVDYGYEVNYMLITTWYIFN